MSELRPRLTRRVARAALVAAGLAMLAACASLPPPAPELATPAAPAPRPEDVSDATLGAREHPRLVAAFGGVHKQPKLETLLNEVVNELVPVSQRPDLRYQVTILNSPTINAFALPGGYLYVTRGLLALASDKAELAAVLAHEMAHVTARHAAQREERARTSSLASRVVSEIVQNPQIAQAAAASSRTTLAGFSRQQELEADLIGLNTVARAGYDPEGGTRFLVAMSRQATLDNLDPRGGGRKNADFLSSHPSTPERIQKAAGLATSLAQSLRERRAGRDAYLEVLDGLLYGDDGPEGFIRGRRFVHAQLGLAFTAPEGFTLENSAKAVFGIGPGGEALRFDATTAPGEGPPVAFVSDGWIEGASVSDARPLIVNELPAATALAQVGEWTFRLGAIRSGETIYRFVLGSKALTPPVDQRFLETIRSFRRLDPNEAAEARPLRIRAVTVGPNDSMTTLAQRMAYDTAKLERFLVLNGLKPGQPLKAGDKVKIVTD
ncbi:MAG: M48 family metalloprotease [Pseudomonadota bacterium]|nr:M48 family metalloprotease [Pseudomonadota bacterium]